VIPEAPPAPPASTSDTSGLSPASRIRFREREELLDFLLEVQGATSETIELEELLARIADTLKPVISYELLAIFLYSERRGTLRIRHAIGHREELVRNLQLGLNEGLVGSAASARTPILTGDVRLDPRYLNTLDAVRSELAVPMTARGKLVGVIDLQSTRLHHFTQQDLALLTLLASRVAFAIENARLHRRVQRDRQNQRTLTELAREITSILALDDLLTHIARALKRLINFDAVSILLVDSQRQILRHRFSQRYDQRLELDNIPLGKGVTGAAVAERKVMRVNDTRADPRYIVTHPEIRSELAVPLIVKDNVIGVIDLESERLNFFNEEHTRLITVLAPQIAVSIENARLYEELAEREKRMDEDLTAARRLQQILLPRQAPAMPRLEAAIGFRPARGISGDVFDFVQHTGDYWMLAFGDSSGKGAAAALYGAMVTGLLRTLAPRRRGPAMLMRAINETLLERKVDAQFVTLTVGLWDGARRELVLANAAGVPPLVWRKGEVRSLTVSGLPLGLLEHQEYDELVFPALPGDAILFFSDGIEDQPNPGQQPYGQSRLPVFFREVAHLPAQELVCAIEADVEAHRGPLEVHDDQTLIALKVL
jgi:sigma-B regulation protein RsbU (phosphoserine phosphatase)